MLVFLRQNHLEDKDKEHAKIKQVYPSHKWRPPGSLHMCIYPILSSSWSPNLLKSMQRPLICSYLECFGSWRLGTHSIIGTRQHWVIKDSSVVVTQSNHLLICLRLPLMNAVNWWCQKHEECVQGLENDLRKERASVTRAELSKSNAEQKIATMDTEMVFLWSPWGYHHQQREVKLSISAKAHVERLLMVQISLRSQLRSAFVKNPMFSGWSGAIEGET